LEARSRRNQLYREAAAVLAAVNAAAHHSPSTTVRDVRGIPLSAPAGYFDGRLPGSARRQLADKWGGALIMGALARSPARSPRGAPSLSTKRRTGVVRVPSVSEKENKEPVRNEFVPRQKKVLPPKLLGSATASPQSSPQSKNRGTRPVLAASQISPLVAALQPVSLSHPFALRSTSPQHRQAARDLSVNLGPRSIREPWSSRGLAAVAAEAVSQAESIAAAQQSKLSPRARSNAGNALSSAGSLARNAVLCSARSGSITHAEPRGPLSPRGVCRDLSPRRSPPASPKLPMRTCVSGRLFGTSARM